MLGCSRIITVTDSQRRLAVLIMRLSGRPDIALHWIRLQQCKQHRWRPGLALNITAEHLVQWRAKFEGDDILQQCLANPASELRAEAHMFLVESVVAERVHTMAAGGLVVPSSHVLQKYLRLLGFAPRSRLVTKHLEAMAMHKSTAKKWSHRFRRSWNLEWSSASSEHRITWATAKTRAGIFVRWVQHVLRIRLGGRPATIINMDETALGNVAASKKGVVLPGVRRRGCGAFAPMDAVIPRTSLVASIASPHCVQTHLPQPRLVRSIGGRVPSRPTMEAYTAAGAPQIAYHGGSGMNTTQIMIWWLGAIAKACKKAAPGKPVVLVMDDCPAHASVAVLAAAARRNIHVIIIPAKMTWALQPLDVHAFRKLKGDIRLREFQKKASIANGRLSPLTRVRLHGEVIKSCLVDGDWSWSLERCGLTGNLTNARQVLRELLDGEDTTPRAPSGPELASIMHLPEHRVDEVRRLLLPTIAAAGAATEHAGADVSAGGGAAAPRSVAAPCVVRPFSLTGLRRLPSRPLCEQPGANLWLPSWATRTVQTRSKTAAAAAASASQPSTEPAAPRPAKKAKK